MIILEDVSPAASQCLDTDGYKVVGSSWVLSVCSSGSVSVLSMPFTFPASTELLFSYVSTTVRHTNNGELFLQV